MAGSVAEMVATDYRTARVFHKYGINYCCGGRWPLEVACISSGAEKEQVEKELLEITQPIQLTMPSSIHEWDVDFLLSFIEQVYHRYFTTGLQQLRQIVARFIEEHSKKYPALQEIEPAFTTWEQFLHPYLQKEKESFFPYIRQIAHAHDNEEPYASSLVRTLHKPVQLQGEQEAAAAEQFLLLITKATDNYTPPAKACTSHRVSFSLLQELHGQLEQYLYLKKNFLYSRIASIEKAILAKR